MLSSELRNKIGYELGIYCVRASLELDEAGFVDSVELTFDLRLGIGRKNSITSLVWAVFEELYIVKPTTEISIEDVSRLEAREMIAA